MLKWISTTVPLSLAEIYKYLQNSGPPPYFEKLAGKLVEWPHLNDDTSAYRLKYRHLKAVEHPTSLRFSEKVGLE